MGAPIPTAMLVEHSAARLLGHIRIMSIMVIVFIVAARSIFSWLAGVAKGAPGLVCEAPWTACLAGLACKAVAKGKESFQETNTTCRS